MSPARLACAKRGDHERGTRPEEANIREVEEEKETRARGKGTKRSRSLRLLLLARRADGVFSLSDLIVVLGLCRGTHKERRGETIFGRLSGVFGVFSARLVSHGSRFLGRLGSGPGFSLLGRVTVFLRRFSEGVRGGRLYASFLLLFEAFPSAALAIMSITYTACPTRPAPPSSVPSPLG